jgi:hypothetical protein
MDLDTFLITLHVVIDDWYKIEVVEKLRRHAGSELKNER